MDSTSTDDPRVRVKHGVCNLCEAICGLKITVRGDEVVGIRGDPDDPLSRGHICPKGIAMADVYADPDRLRRPVKRVVRADGDIEWQPIGWAEAIEFAADSLSRIANTHGRNSLGVYLGNPNVHSLGSMTHGTALVKSIRTKNTFSATSVDQLPHQLTSRLLFGHQLLLGIPDIDRTQHFLVFGANPIASNGSLMTVPDFANRVRAMKRRGARMVVLDPRRTETAKVADEHHFVRPGTDAFVLLAMLNVLFTDNLVRPADYLDSIDEVRAALAGFTPELAETHSGLSAGTVRALARDFAAAESAVAYARVGLSTQEFGLICQWAINLLNLLTGNLDRAGGALFTRPAIDLTGSGSGRRGLIGPGHFGKWHSRVRRAPEFSSELPVSVLSEEIETPGDDQIRAMLLMSGNPVLSTPDGARLDRAMAHLEFAVAIDFHINETTRHADVILPPTSALERDHYDLLFAALAVRDTARFTPAVFKKPAGTRHDWQIYRDLADALEPRMRHRPGWRRRAVRRARMSLSPTQLVTVLLRRTGRTSMRALRKSPGGVDLGPLTAGQLPNRLHTQGKRIDLLPDLIVTDLPRLASRTANPADALLLIGRRHLRDCNSWLHNTTRLTSGRARHQLLMNPDDLARLGIQSASRVRVSSAVGYVDTEVLASADLMPGVVSLPHGYGHGRAGTRMRHANQLPGVSINDLTDPNRTDVSGNAVLSGVPVRVQPIA